MVATIGVIAVDGISLSRIGMGTMAFAGIDIGWAAVGDLAIGTTHVLGGLTVSFHLAIGGLPTHSEQYHFDDGGKREA